MFAFGNIYIRLYQYCWQLFWKFLKDTLIHPQSAHTLTDKSKRRRHAGRTLNILMSVCLIACKCSFSSSKTQHACTNANVYDCFTMQLVLCPKLGQCPYKWGVGSAFHRMKIHILPEIGNDEVLRPLECISVYGNQIPTHTGFDPVGKKYKD